MEMKENKSKEEIFRFLEEKGISYRAFSHEKTDDPEEKLKHDAQAGIENATHCKNLVLANRQKTKLFLLTMPLEKRFRTGPTSRQMGSGRLNFAEEEHLDRVLHTRSGMVSPLELIFDTEKQISYYMDADLKKAERLCFHPSDDTCTVVFERDEFFGKVLPAMEVLVGFVTIEETQEVL